jgi:hypothetical protein
MANPPFVLKDGTVHPHWDACSDSHEDGIAGWLALA